MTEAHCQSAQRLRSDQARVSEHAPKNGPIERLRLELAPLPSLVASKFFPPVVQRRRPQSLSKHLMVAAKYSVAFFFYSFVLAFYRLAFHILLLLDLGKPSRPAPSPRRDDHQVFAVDDLLPLLPFVEGPFAGQILMVLEEHALADLHAYFIAFGALVHSQVPFTSILFPAFCFFGSRHRRGLGGRPNFLVLRLISCLVQLSLQGLGYVASNFRLLLFLLAALFLVLLALTRAKGLVKSDWAISKLDDEVIIEFIEKLLGVDFFSSRGVSNLRFNKPGRLQWQLAKPKLYLIIFG